MAKKDPGLDREDLKDEAPEVDDDLEVAEAKSRSVDERAGDGLGVDHAVGIDAPVPAAFVPQGGIAVPRGVDEPGPGEAVLEKERQHRTIPKQRG
jgi:hypothetical protein